jgi:hypothetical protein
LKGSVSGFDDEGGDPVWYFLEESGLDSLLSSFDDESGEFWVFLSLCHELSRRR